MAISIRGTPSAWVASNATTQTVTLPTHAAGDMLIVRAACKPYTASITCATAGWTAAGTGYANGATANGNGLGSLMFRAFYKVATSSSETSPVITWGTTSAPGAACAVAYQCAADEGFSAAVGAGGGDATARTAHTATISTHISTTAGDMVDFYSAWCDNYAATVPTFTQAGLTLGTVSEQPDAALSDATSNDIAADGGYRLVSSGTSSAAAVVTGTFGNSEEGGSWTTRLRVAKLVTLGLIDAGPAIYSLTVYPDQFVTLPLIEQASLVALEIVAVASAVTPTTDTTITVSKPSGTAEGDTMYFVVYLTASTGSITTPSGWTAIYSNSVPASSTSSHASLFRKTAGASEPSSYSVTISSGRASASIITVRGAATSDDATGEAVDTTAGLTVTAPDVTATGTNELLLSWFGGRVLGNWATAVWAPPASETEIVDVAIALDTLSGSSHEVTYQTRSASGATGTRSAVASGSGVTSINWIAYSVLVKAVAAGSLTGVYDLVVEGLPVFGDQDLTVGLIDSGSAVYAPTLVKAPYPITLGVIESTSAVYDLTVTPKNTLMVGLIDAASAIYSLTVPPPTAPITLGLVGTDSTIYSLTVVKAPYPVILGVIDSGPAIYDASVEQGPAQDPGNYMFPLLLGYHMVIGPSSVYVGFIDSGPVVYGLTVVPQPVTVTLGAIESTPAVYSLTVFPDQFVTLGVVGADPAIYNLTLVTAPYPISIGLIDAASAIYSLTLVKAPYSISIGLIDAAPAVYSLSLTPKNLVSLDLIDAGNAVYSLSVGHTVALGFIDATSAIYGLTLVKAPYPIVLGLIDAGPAVYDLTAEKVGGEMQPVVLDLIDAGAAIYSVTVAHGLLRLTVDLIDAGPTTYDLTVVGLGNVTQTMIVDLIDGAPAIYSLGVQAVNLVSLGLIDSGPVVYGLTLTAKSTVVLGLIDGGPAVYAPTLSKAPYPISIGLIDSGSVVYSLVVMPDQFLTLGVVDGAPAIYSLTLQQAQFLTLGLIDASKAIYNLTVAHGLLRVTLGVVGNDPVVYDASLVRQQGVILDVVGDGWAIYELPFVAHYGPPQSVTLALIVSEWAVYRVHPKKKWSLAQRLAMDGLGTGSRRAKPREYTRL